MARRLFGKSSEKLDPAQLQMVFSNLALEAEPAAAALSQTPPAAGSPDIPPAVSKKRSLAGLMEGLPVTVTTLTPPEVLACPDAWRAIGNEERTRLLDYTPGRFGVHLIVRPKYVRIDAPRTPPVTAPLHLLQNRCMATPRLLAGVLTLRFERHLPYYRIEQLYARAGVPLSRQTLSCRAGMAAEAATVPPSLHPHHQLPPCWSRRPGVSDRSLYPPALAGGDHQKPHPPHPSRLGRRTPNQGSTRSPFTAA